MSSPVSVIVLAGGLSRRLGADKAFLEMDGQSLIQRIVTKMSSLSGDVVVVTNSADKFSHLGTRLIKDVYPGKGALGGIYSGLLAAQNEHSVVVACDMPLLDLDLLRYMILLAHDQDVVIPRVDGFLEPLHTVYSRRCLEPINELLAQGGLKILDFFPKVRVRYVEEEEVNIFDPEHLSFWNVNTPADWERLQDLLEREGGNVVGYSTGTRKRANR